MTTHYSHRNGETEPPTIEGRFWFEGERMNGTPEKDIVKVGYDYGDEMHVTFAFHGGHCYAYELIGKWYGPVIPPWQE